MGKMVAAIDYLRCQPDRCERGVCLAASDCEHGSLVQMSAYEMPEVNPAKWCHGCAKCSTACPLKAIRMIDS